MEPDETDPSVTEPSATEPSATDVAPTGRAGSRAGFVLAVSLAVAFGLLAAVLAVLLADARSDADDAASDLRRTAGQFGEALVTYDHRDPEAHRDAVLGMATGSFREEYEDAFEGELVQIITEVEAVSQGFVKDVFVSEIDEESASAVVVVDVEHDGAAGPRTLYDIYFRLTFVRVGGDWKVDQVIDLNFGAGPAGGETDVTTDTTGTTTTSVP
jgi:Mce-associated membrane protein